MSTFGYGWVYRGIFQLIWVYMGTVMAVSGTENGHFGACGAPWTKNTKNLKSPRNGKNPLGCQQISLGASKRVPGRQKRRKKNDVFRLFFLDFMKSIFRISRISGFH